MTAMIATTFNWVGLTRIAHWFKKIYEHLERRSQVNSTIRELSKLSDKELNDIGISRGDIWWVANEAYYDNRDGLMDENKNLKGWV
jgi:uncharacterized protein YjiS (DUF1127 family)